jgi:hypothetical protein
MKNMTSYRYRIHDHRAVWVVIALVALCAGLLMPWALSPIQAQGGGQPISVGDIVTGTLDSTNFVRIYTLSASAGDTISIDVSTTVEALAPVVVVTDERGSVVVQDVDTATPTTATITEFEMPSNGTFYIMVMRGTGAAGDASGSFTLKLSGFQQIGGQTITLTEGGIVFDLVWNAAVNLNMEVRDPVGGTVHRRHPGTASGGTLDADVNATCDTATAAQPTETIAWPAGTVPVGSYEVIIYYTDACAVGGPQLFTLNTSVNDETPQSLTGTINPGQQYLARLVLDGDGGWRLVNGGVNAGLDVSIFRNEIANADPIAVGSTVSGVITNSTPAHVYTFTASAGTTVDISMDAQSGSLDTYLVLLGTDNTPLVSNDDTGDSTNASITRTLAVDGTYTIIATRYGLTIGGTEGEYNLTLTAQTGEATTPGATPAATTGGTSTATETPVAESLPNGAIEVKLEWATQADLQLLVRDPLGDSVFDDKLISDSGGVMDLQGNVNCNAPTDNPISYIYWPPNRLLPGVYEIEVWYQNTCNDTRPVNFGLTVNVQDQTIINTTQPTSPNSRYMITFTVEQDGTVIAGPGGFFDMANAASLNYEAVLSTATPISYGQTVSGSITAQQRFVVYSFEGEVGDIVTIGMTAQGGTLDPALYLISPEQIQISYNDDVTPGENANSVIDKVTLPSTGTYYIIATHYGLNVGGTQGTFNLTLVQD